MQTQTATFAGGCFWCTEAIFQQLRGVQKVVSGYTGGVVDNPDYWAVHSGDTNHAEAIQIEFDPAIISYADLLEIFWHTHDPTTLNQDGANIGAEYRSAIFYHDSDQKRIAQESRDKLAASKYYPNPIVTEITAFTKFYSAEAEHQDFYARNPNAGYCRVIISPKLQKLREKYRDKLKTS